MQRLSKLSFISFSISLGCIGCGSLNPSSKITESVSPGTVTDWGRLGLGYEPFTQTLLSTPCVSGDVIEVGSKEARLEYLQDLGVAALNRRLSLALGWSNALLAVSPEIDFLKSSAASSLSNTYSIFFEIRGKSEELAAESLRLSEALHSQMDALSRSDVFTHCGQEYISRIDYAAALLATIKIEFLTQEDKLEFTTKAAVNFPAPTGQELLSGSFSKLSQELKQRTRVVVLARQFGGNPNKLLQILPSGIAKCSLDDLTPCLSVFENLANYSQSLNEQFTSPADYVPVKYETKRYLDQFKLTGLLPWTDFHPTEKETIEQLQAELQKREQDRLRTLHVLNLYSSYLPAERVQALRTLESVLTKDVNALKNQIQSCSALILQSKNFEVPLVCRPQKLSSYDSSLISSPFDKLEFKDHFNSSEPLRGLHFTSSRNRIAQVEHQAENNSITISLQNLGRWNCQKNQWASLSLPITAPSAGVYTLSAQVALGSCSHCNAQLAVSFDQTSFIYSPREISRDITQPTRVEKQIRLGQGQHTVSIRLESNEICNGNQAKLDLQDLRIERRVTPFQEDISL